MHADLAARPLPAVAVAVVDADPSFRTRLALRLGESVRCSAFDSIVALEEGMPAGVNLVVVLGPACDDPFSLREVERLVRERPEAGVILLVEELTTEVMRLGLRVGVRDVLAADTPVPQVLEAVGRVGATLQAPGRPRADGVPEPGSTGRLMTVFSTKGGAGKSVLASNLAVVLKQRTERPVALVDADLQFGDLAVMLRLTPRHTVVDAVGAIDRLDAPMLQSLLIREEASGVLVLPAPLEPAFADQVGAADMLQIVSLLQSFCEFVVVDTPAYFNDVVLGLLEASDDILMVAGLDIPNIKNVKIGLQTLQLLNIPSHKLRLVLNRANSKVKLDVADVEQTLRLKAECLVPSDVAVPMSVNRGVPIAIAAPRSEVTRAVERFADQFAPATSGGGRRWRR